MAGVYLIASDRATGRTIAARVLKADTAETRTRGLLGRTSMDAGEGLWIVPCPMIHTFFMKFPIDVVFLNRRLEVVRVIENLKPWRLSPWVLRAHSALELAGGALKGSLKKGDALAIS